MLTRRRLLAGAGATAAAGMLGVAKLAASPDPQATLLTILNGERSHNGLAPATPNPLMQLQAEEQAAALATHQWLFHLEQGKFDWWINPDRPGNLWWAGEIVGYGQASEAGLLALDHLWLRSDYHREILLHPRAALCGVGVREAAGLYWASAFFGTT